MVAELMLTEGIVNQSEIARRLHWDRSIIKIDIQALTEDSEFWVHASARLSWALQSRKFYTDAVQEIEFMKRILKQRHKASTLSQIARMEDAINRKRSFVIQLMTSMPLLRKMQNLAKWVEENQPKETREIIPAQVTESLKDGI